MYKWIPVTIITMAICVCGYSESSALANEAGVADADVYTLGGRGFIKKWIVAGTFPSPEVDDEHTGGSRHIGFDKDYLKSIGEEMNAALTSDTVITYDGENGETVSVHSQIAVASDSGVVDLDALFVNPDNVMAYASSSIYSDKDQDAMFLLGSDDGVKVWVNGELVHSNYISRGLALGQDRFSVKLHKGNNTVLVKVIDVVRGWGFAVEVLDENAYAKEKEIQHVKQAQIDSMIPKEEILWPDGIKNNPIAYEQQNIMKTGEWHPDAPLQISRGYSNVATPTYYVYPAAPEKNTGVGIVILPGGGYDDVWLDTEGHNIALHFKEHGITALVVKYRTNTRDSNGKRPLPWDDYMSAATADANEGIRILRSRAEELKLDPNKIGVGGFSAGAHLSLSVCVNSDTKESYPDFAFLIYPWLQEDSAEQVEQAHGLPPMFIVNGQEDTDTPADVCAQFYYTLCKNKVPAELHIYTKGTHGFTLGLGHGHSTVQWTNSFIAWLKDIDMIEE